MSGQPVGSAGLSDLPGEHGFRFFPGFYRHLPDTMSRIPYGTRTVAGNLVESTRILVARAGMPPIELLARLPQVPDDWALALHDLFSGIGVPDDEVLYFVDRLLLLMTSCPERRLAEYEKIPWWDFIGAATRSKTYQTLLAHGLTRSLVAMRAEEGSTRTVGYILLQLLYGILSPQGFDRLLSGPTNDVWLTPWVQYLTQQGVAFHSGVTITEIQASSAGVTGGGGAAERPAYRDHGGLLHCRHAGRDHVGVGHGFAEDVRPVAGGIEQSQGPLDERHSVLPGEGCARRARTHAVRRFAVGADLDFPEAVLARRSAFQFRRGQGGRPAVGGHLRVGDAGHPGPQARHAMHARKRSRTRCGRN